MKTLLLTTAAMLSIAAIGPALAQTAPAAGGHHGMATKITTRAEVAQNVQQHFAKADTNRDGFLTKAETDAAAETMHARKGQKLEQRGGAMFDRLDSNHDGSITRPEAETAIAAHQAQGAKAGRPAPSWDKLAGRLDSNKDGAISRSEFEAAHAKRSERAAEHGGKGMHGAMAGRMFDTADANKDGRVSLTEATAAATAHFDAADANRDGTLTPDERRAAHKGMRGHAGS
jgi:Ca2+-binding EF-hand superfamily protein